MKKFRFSDHIIFESDDYVLINKPPFISTLEDRNEAINILNQAKQYCKSAQVCHRLDKETSGILVLSKNTEAYSHMSTQFEKRVVEKTYHAVSAGIHNFQEIEVNAPITSLGKGVVKIDKVEGKMANTIINTLKAYRKATLIECRPITGRMHQIRIHLALLKAPIMEDLQYGGKHFYLSYIKSNFNLKKDTEEMPLIKRVALHANSIRFQDLKGNVIYQEAPYPKDFAVLLKQLDKYSSN